MESLKALSFYQAWGCSGEIITATPTEGLDTLESEFVEQHAFAALVFLNKGGKQNFENAHRHLQRICSETNALCIYPVNVLDIIAEHTYQTTFAECLQEQNKEHFYGICEKYYQTNLENNECDEDDECGYNFGIVNEEGDKEIEYGEEEKSDDSEECEAIEEVEQFVILKSNKHKATDNCSPRASLHFAHSPKQQKVH